MKQVLHIFAKDTRRFWPEILLSLATLAALVIVYPMQWKLPPGTLGMQARNTFIFSHTLLNAACSLLVLLSWVLLIARVVYEEPLVGDRQFWITRPYGWGQLLGAKLLFVVLYLYPPLVAAQCICMVSAGVHPFDGISTLAAYLFLLTGLVVLPVTAIASVTANQAKLTFIAIGILLYGLVSAALWFRSLFWSLSGLKQQYFQYFQNAAGVPAVLCALVIVLQYATRRTALARLILIGAIALGVCAHIASTTANSSAIRASIWQKFRASDFSSIAQAPFQLTYSPSDKHPVLANVTKDYDRQPVVDVRIPMTYAVVGQDAAMHLEMFAVEFDGADGFRWSTLQNNFWPTEYLSKMRFWPGFFMPVAVYDRLKTGPATVKLTLYYDELQPTDTVRSTLSADSYDIPGSVHCGVGITHAWLLCRTAARQAPILNVNADFSTDPCPTSQPELREGAGPRWSGFGDQEITQANLIPIREFVFTFAHDRNNSTGGTHLCTGAPVTFTRYKIAGRKQATFFIQDFQLPVSPFKAPSF